MKTKLSCTVKYSERKLDFLDTTIYLEDGKLEFDVYSKPTDSHLSLLPDSCHPKENTENIPYGVALRLQRRICSKEETFDNRSKEYKQFFVNRDFKIKNRIDCNEKNVILSRVHLVRFNM